MCIYAGYDNSTYKVGIDKQALDNIIPDAHICLLPNLLIKYDSD